MKRLFLLVSRLFQPSLVYFCAGFYSLTISARVGEVPAHERGRSSVGTDETVAETV